MLVGERGIRLFGRLSFSDFSGWLGLRLFDLGHRQNPREMTQLDVCCVIDCGDSGSGRWVVLYVLVW